MLLKDWTFTRPDGSDHPEMALCFDAGRPNRVLILPALFDEANKMRRQTVLVMRALDEGQIDSFLPDLPGQNESTGNLADQSLADWQEAAKQAAQQFGASHILTLRGGALFAPQDLPGWHYAPVKGARLLRSMIRARTLAAREAGKEETTAQLEEMGSKEGLELAGWRLGAQMFRDLQAAEPGLGPQQGEVAQSQLGGAGLWLRAEPSEDAAQAQALADMIIASIGSAE